MAISIVQTERNLMLEVLRAAVDVASTTIEVGTGSVGAFGTILATFTVGANWDNAISNPNGTTSRFTIATGLPASVSAAATGTATVGRVRKAGTTTVWEGAVGTDFTVSPAAITSGQTVNLTSVQLDLVGI